MVIVTIGQSNAANALPSFGKLNASVQAYNFLDGKCYLIEDPVLGATGNRGSLWTAFAQELSLTAAGRPVIMITGAVDGSTIRQWLLSPTEYATAVEKQISLARDNELQPDVFIWHQGEADAVAGTSQTDYEKYMQRLIERFRTGADTQVPAKWIVFQASRCLTKPEGSASIRAAQAAVAKRLPGVFIAMSTDELGERFRYDSCHFNANGRRIIVDRLVQLFMQLIEPSHR